MSIECHRGRAWGELGVGGATKNMCRRGKVCVCGGVKEVSGACSVYVILTALVAWE